MLNNECFRTSMFQILNQEFYFFYMFTANSYIRWKNINL